MYLSNKKQKLDFSCLVTATKKNNILQNYNERKSYSSSMTEWLNSHMVFVLCIIETAIEGSLKEGEDSFQHIVGFCLP